MLLTLWICTVEPLYSGHPWGTTFWPLYRSGLYWGVGFVHKLFIWDLVSWPLYRGGLYSGVAVKRGSTVSAQTALNCYVYTSHKNYWSNTPTTTNSVLSLEMLLPSYHNNLDGDWLTIRESRTLNLCFSVCACMYKYKRRLCTLTDVYI